ncbi:fimbrillin family protein [Bacteroides stercorirosoris]|uniref:Fimbrillin-like n=1 Tax=Bacteroides stercorirosoris TaxID=871324 RepID=A0A1M6AEE0_9BACE|nr:fimbrillin family protein [Bacteroides stercorirosoris]SHI34829.1 Fimbrillin-like [Bacteroides stercorirosoris]
MKKILLAAVAALAIVGCTQNEEIENVGNKAEINFGTVVSKTTRAAVTENVDLQNSGFIVYAYNTADAIGVEGVKLGDAFMKGVKVTCPSGTWTIDGTYYWPYEGKVQFFAYAVDDNATNYSVAENAKYPTLNYTIKALASEQKDFVVAKVTDEVKKSTAVTLKFAHALTQVNFSVKGADALTYKVTALALEGIAKTGTYSFENDTWNATGTTDASYSYPIAQDASVTGTDAVQLDQVDGALMLMPQQMTAAAKIKLSYDVYKNGVKVDVVTNTTIDLNNTAAWEAGKKVRYTLTLSNTAATVSFAPEVGPWSTVDDTPVTPPAE